MKIAIASDHAGFEEKERLKPLLDELGIQFEDLGTVSTDSVDYPDYARKVGEEVAAGKVDQGLLVCGSGTGMAIAAKNGDYAGPSSIHNGQMPTRTNMLWQSKVEPSQNDPYVNEWNDLIDAVRNDKPYNEVPFGVQASVVTSMGRMAAHTGQEITYDEMLNHPHEYAPGIDKWTMDSPPPVKSDADGKYPVPMPGVKKDREF